MALPLIVGVSGASGAICGVRPLKALHDVEVPTHLIASKSAAVTLKKEAGLTVNEVCDRWRPPRTAPLMPPVLAFCHQPMTIDDIVNQTVGRCLDLFDIDSGLVKRWRSDT